MANINFAYSYIPFITMENENLISMECMFPACKTHPPLL